MELVGAISAREWNSLNGIFNSDQQADHQLMAAHNFLAETAFLNYHHPSTTGASSLEFPFAICSYEGSTSHCSSGTFAGSYPYSSTYSHDQPVTLVTSNSSLALPEEDINAIRNTDLFLNIEGDRDLQQCVNQLAVLSHNTKAPEENAEESGSLFAGNPKKRPTSTTSTFEADHDLELKNKSNVKSRKNKRLAMKDEEESNASQEEIAGIASSLSPKGSAMALNVNGKARASRGFATDPQSVYARKRREKINEKLRILQNLVPNGTKVDISTMLEEAVQYVKFLQLQIKLLSSNDLWMYAPLAYNGMNIGIDLRLAAPNQYWI